MMESYFLLPSKDKEFFLSLQAETFPKFSTVVLEKDIWLCHVLELLFQIPNIPPIVFKGGTSLSKVFGAIDRFSEDVDVSISYKHLLNDDSIDIYSISRAKAKKVSEALKLKVKKLRDGVIVPYLKDHLPAETNIEVDESGEKIWIKYPSSSLLSHSYIQQAVLIELGGRNTVVPSKVFLVKPYASHENILLPSAQVNVLAPERTFLEKAVLIHVDNHRESRPSYERYSRHWYDLAKLAKMQIGQDAIADNALLQQIVAHNKVFYNASYANFDKCLDKQFVLVPNKEKMALLSNDFSQMKNSSMLYDSISFKDVIEIVAEVEKALNK